jgi:hypothetical protein
MMLRRESRPTMCLRPSASSNLIQNTQCLLTFGLGEIPCELAGDRDDRRGYGACLRKAPQRCTFGALREAARASISRNSWFVQCALSYFGL